MGAHKLLSASASFFIAILLTGIGGSPAQAATPLARAATPATPTITEPPTDGQLVSGADVHMETAPFQDNDSGDQHLCSDWEIWTVPPAAVQRVWFAGCISGVQKVHTHLGDGVFENSYAGRRELLADTSYELRVRHRDDSGDAATEWSAYAKRGFRTDTERKPLPGSDDWRVTQPGYVVEQVADGFRLPVNIAMVPKYAGDSAKPMFYVTELYGSIKVVHGDFTVSTYAKDLLDFDPSGQFPGSGEMGLTGIVVEPTTGDVFASMLYKTGDRHYPKVVRFHSTDGGLTASSETTILRMGGAPQEASHQISNLTIGPDGKLYVHMGDGFTPSVARNLDSFRGKILRLNLDGSAPADNPYYKASDGISARDYVFAYGFRNPFGGAWRVADGKHYEVENGPSANDRLVRVARGTDYGWDGSEGSMKTRALYNWDPPHGPVNIAFTEPQNYHAGGFPQDKYGHAFVSESGPTWATGPQSRGKRITEFSFNADGSASGPKTLVEYNGNGKTSVVGLATGPEGLYFTGLYPEKGGPTDSGAKIYRVRYAPEPSADTPLLTYADSGFRGDRQGFGTGVFESSKGELDGVGNDTISSLKVGGGFRVMVCANTSKGVNTNAGNLGRCRYYGPGLHTSVGKDLNDQISLIAVMTGPAPGNGVVAYSDSNFGGASQSMGPGGYEAVAGELSKVGVAKISSLKVAADHETVVCQYDRSSGVNSGNLGLCRYFAPGDHPTVGSDLDNRISLVAIGGPALTAFKDAGYNGSSTRFRPGIYDASRGQLGAVGDDAITSLRVAAGYRVVACQNDSVGRTNSGSLGLCRYYSSGQYTFGGGDLDNGISLLAVLAGPSSGDRLTAYQDRDFNGTSTRFGVGIHEASKNELGRVGNDRISSLRVAAGNRAIVCHDASGATNTNAGSLGLCRYYASGDHKSLASDLNDNLSLIAVAP